MSMRKKTLKTMMILSVMVLLGAFGLHSALSGQLDPATAPGPTMYTLEEIYNFRVWRMMGKTFVNHPGNNRFAVYDAGTGADTSDDLVLDKDTGLIWARDASTLGGLQEGETAALDCRSYDGGDRMGWRIPSIEELSSLIDTSQDSPALPAGHPFVNVQFDAVDDYYYWADLTISATNTGFAWGLNMRDGSLALDLDPQGGGDTAYMWPVWGGKSVGF